MALKSHATQVKVSVIQANVGLGYD